MYTFRTDVTNWFLEDRSLEHVVKQLASESGEKRVHLTREYDHGKVFIKFFPEKGISGLVRNRLLPRGKKEYELSKRLRMLSVLTPRALGYGIGPHGSYVIQEWLRGESLLDWKGDSDKGEQLLSALVTILEKLKIAGFRHNDLHLANIIQSSGRLFLVDLHKGSFRKNFTCDDDVSNVSHALAMLYDGMAEREKEWFFSHYGGKELRLLVEHELVRLRRRWVERKAQRAFRTTSVLVNAQNRVIVRGMEHKAIGTYLSTIKKDKKVTVQRYTDHLRKTYAHKRRLLRAWKHHVILEYMRLSITPRPYYVQQASLSIPGYIAMEDLTGKGEELDRFLDRTYDRMDRSARHLFVDAFSSFLVSALKKTIIHADLKACNVFVIKNGSLLFLDIEDLDFSGFDAREIKRMLVQLNTTIPVRISTRDRLRFFHKVTEPFFSQSAGRRVLREIVSDSLKKEIVYEGVDELKKEVWKQHR